MTVPVFDHDDMLRPLLMMECLEVVQRALITLAPRPRRSASWTSD